MFNGHPEGESSYSLIMLFLKFSLNLPLKQIKKRPYAMLAIVSVVNAIDDSAIIDVDV